MYSETDCLVRMGRDDSRLLLCRNLFLARFSSISHSCASFISHACLFYLLLVSLRSLTHHASSISHSSLSFISHVCLFYLSLVCLFHFSLVSLRSLTCVSLSFLTHLSLVSLFHISRVSLRSLTHHASSISHSSLSFISHFFFYFSARCGGFATGTPEPAPSVSSKSRRQSIRDRLGRCVCIPSCAYRSPQACRVLTV